MKHVLVATILFAGACTQSSSGSPQTQNALHVDGAEAKKLVASGALLLDVRSAEEFADGHIEGARNVPVNEIRSAIASLPKDKPIVVYCAVGARATVAARELAAAGFTVHNLGAMASWSR